MNQEELTALLPDVIALRHELHAHPECSGKEFKTSELLRGKLRELGIEPEKPFLGTDVVALIHGGKGPGKNVTLRADTDALAITEKTGLPYASTNCNVMHACGHDGHTAMLYGAARLLYRHRNEFAGSVRLVWQPGEENLQLGRDLVKAGVLEHPRADYVTALHGMPGLETGKLGIRTGASEASVIHFSITVYGKGGHSSRPHLTCDPVVAASAMVLELQTAVSRRIDPLKSAVLSICSIHGGNQSNVIPDSVELAGTARSLQREVDEELKKALLEISSSIAAAHHCRAEVRFDSCYPVTVNTPAAADLARKVIRQKLSPELLWERPEPSMSADDFAWYTMEHEGVYVKIGTGNTTGLHTATFDFPDAALASGIAFFYEFALAGLQE